MPQRLAAPEAQKIDLVLIRESTEGLFYSAAVHGRSKFEGDQAVEETLRITRSTTEKLHRFAFKLADKRRARGHKGTVTCVDKANVFSALAFFRKIFYEVKSEFPHAETGYQYVDAMALERSASPGILMSWSLKICLAIFCRIWRLVWLVAWGWHLAGKLATVLACSSPPMAARLILWGKIKPTRWRQF